MICFDLTEFVNTSAANEQSDHSLCKVRDLSGRAGNDPNAQVQIPLPVRGLSLSLSLSLSP
jgi:hypothetical protein